MPSRVFLTGGTGFVGSHLILELLMQTDSSIHCLVRARNGKDPAQRLLEVLEAVIQGGGYAPELLEQARQRCHVLAGDLTDDLSALAQVSGISEFWHCAASLNYEERFADEIMAVNIEGTRKALELARQLGVDTFNYVSTAYVVGKASGLIREDRVQQAENSNVYERSKVLAESLIEAESRFNTRIFRPSIVIGHSKTYHAINFSGLYGFLRRLIQFKGMMARVQRGYLDRESIRMQVDPDVPLNLVPVDQVASEAVQIARKHAGSGYFHLTNPDAPSVKEVIEATFRSAGIKPPLLVDSAEEFNWIDEKFNEKIEFYNSYLRGNKLFDRSNADAFIEPSSGGSVTRDNLQHYCDWYSEQLLKTRSKLPVSR